MANGFLLGKPGSSEKFTTIAFVNVTPSGDDYVINISQLKFREGAKLYFSVYSVDNIPDDGFQFLMGFAPVDTTTAQESGTLFYIRKSTTRNNVERLGVILSLMNQTEIYIHLSQTQLPGQVYTPLSFTAAIWEAAE